MTEDDVLKITNDISEDIDCGESREKLREVIKWWANRHATIVLRKNAYLLEIITKATEGITDNEE